jgi:hypothetical protein
MGGKGSGSTPAQRDRNALCGAIKRNGEKCRKYAGEGTPHLGVGKCKYHGGNTPSHKKHAIKVKAEQEATKAQQMLAAQFGQLVAIEPTEALMTVLHLSFGHLCWLRSELANAPDKTTFAGQVFMRMYDDERDRVARISKAALDAGVQERTIKLAERWGEMLADLLSGILGELALTARQQAAVPAIVRRHLIAVEGREDVPDVLPALPAAAHPARGRRKRAAS